MSQRCLITYTKNIIDEDKYYDCIYDENGNLEILLDEWLGMDADRRFYIGPWKLNIRDKELFERFIKDFIKIKEYCKELKSLEDLWSLAVDGINVYINEPQTEWMNDILKQIVDNQK
jgi:hypothetical protein